MDKNSQVYFDLEENIPAEDLERYKRAASEEDVLVHKQTKEEFQARIKEIQEREAAILERLAKND